MSFLLYHRCSATASVGHFWCSPRCSALIPASDLALTVLNWDLTHFFPPRLLPRMDTAEGIPEDAATFVVVPTIFLSESQVHELVERLEVHFLANQDQHIYFALLGDFPDAESEETPNDSHLLAIAQSGIDALNRRHGEAIAFISFIAGDSGMPAKTNGWVGNENEASSKSLIGCFAARETPASSCALPTMRCCRSIRYVITLDSDTQLPRDVARKLVGAAIHPLNQPGIDAATNRVTYGYGILQPRVSISLASASRSKFVQVFSGYTGIDPYTTAVSDVYQDFFGEGSFTGKGLYDVDAFQRTLENRVPANSLLSHDLFESFVCARRTDNGHRAARRLSGVVRSLRKTSASLDARRLANRALAFSDSAGRRASKGAQRTAADRALEDPRQPAAQPRRAVVVPVARCFVRVVSGFGVALVSVCFSGDRVSGLPARDHRSVDPSARHSVDQPFLECLGRLPHQHRADRAVVCFSAAPGVADVRRDRSRALPAIDLAQETARMGFGSGS